MTEHPSPTPEGVADLLRQVETILTHTRGNAGQSTITVQTSTGAAASVYLLTSRDTRLGAVSSIGVTVWMLTPLILVVAFAEVTKNGFGIRWDIYMVVWALCWSISMFFPTAAVRMPPVAVIAIAFPVGALVEARRRAPNIPAIGWSTSSSIRFVSH